MKHRHLLSTLLVAGVATVVALSLGRLTTTPDPDLRPGAVSEPGSAELSAPPDRAEDHRQRIVDVTEVSGSEDASAPRWATAPERPVYRVRGQVTRTDGTGAGASVRVYSALRSAAREPLMDVAHRIAAYEPVAKAECDADGLFEIGLDAPGSYVLEARADGLATLVEGPLVLGAEEREYVVLAALTAGLSITGRVVSEGAARFVPEVHVLEKLPGSWGCYHARRVACDPGGRFSIGGLDSEPRTFVVFSEGVARFFPSVRAPQTSLLLTVRRPVIVAGTVLAAGSGRPIAGARVRALNQLSAASAVTGDGGVFELSMSRGPGSLSVVHDGFVPTLQQVEFDDSQFVVELAEVRVHERRIVDQEGRGVPGVEVGVLRTGDPGETVLTVFTDEYGRFRLPGGADATRGLIIPRVKGRAAALDAPAARLPGTGDLALAPTLPMEGRVVMGAAYEPVQGARVRLAWRGTELERRAVGWLRGVQSCETDGDGTWRLEDVVPGQYAIHVSYPGFADLVRDYDPRNLVPVTLVLGLGARIEGTVRTPTGASRLVEVVVSWPGGPQASRNRRTGRLEGGLACVIEAGEPFEFEGLPPGLITLRAEAPGLVDTVRTLEVAAGETGRVDLELATGRTVRVHFTGPAGAPRSDAVVNLQGMTNSGRRLHRRERTDAAGRCEFRSVAPGTFTVYSRQSHTPLVIEETGRGELLVELD